MKLRIAGLVVVAAAAAACSATLDTASTTTGSLAPASSATPSGSLTPTPMPVAQTVALASVALKTISVKGRAPRSGYSRTEFGTSWTDANTTSDGHNGCDTRNDILRRDLIDLLVKPGTSGCVAFTGTLRDPYTGRTIRFTRSHGAAVQIDHVVALADAWQTGAQLLAPAQRIDLANDPLELLAVDGSTNDAKGDGDAATWLPPNRSYRCAYVARQIAVKRAYHLWMTRPEATAVARVLATCPGQTVPTRADTPRVVVTAPASSATRSSGSPSVRHLVPSRPSASTSSAPKRAHRRTTPTPTPRTSTVTAGCTTTSSGRCIRKGQFCPQSKEAQSGTDADGDTLTCTDIDNDGHPHWE